MPKLGSLAKAPPPSAPHHEPHPRPLESAVAIGKWEIRYFGWLFPSLLQPALYLHLYLIRMAEARKFETIAAANQWQPAERPLLLNVPIVASSTFLCSSVEHAQCIAAGKLEVGNRTLLENLPKSKKTSAIGFSSQGRTFFFVCVCVFHLLAKTFWVVSSSTGSQKN